MFIKRCSKCKRIKLVKFFSPRNNSKTPYTSRCKKCRKKDERLRRVVHKDRISAQRKMLRELKKETPTYKAQKLLSGMKHRSKKYGGGVPEWTVEEITEIIQDGSCAKTGIKFDITATEWTRNPNAPSPDRIDSSKGYTKENTQWVCLMYNQMKNEYPEEHVADFINKYIEFNNENTNT